MVHTTGSNGRYRQLTKLPMRTHRFRGACVDPPSDAEVYETKLRDGDIVILWVRHLHASAAYHIQRFAHPGVTDRRLVRQRLPVRDRIDLLARVASIRARATTAAKRAVYSGLGSGADRCTSARVQFAKLAGGYDLIR